MLDYLHGIAISATKNRALELYALVLIVGIVLVLRLVANAKRKARNFYRQEPWLAVSARDTLDTTRWSLALLRALEWKRFEHVCAAYFQAIGFRTRTARAGADGGIDIYLYSESSSKPSIVVQCKAWNVYQVGVKPVRELYGVMAREGVSEGIFLTTSHFTEEARRFPKGNEMHLWDGPEFLRKIEELISDKQSTLLRIATDGDFRTPTCPSCAIKMVNRTSKRDGKPFWGCLNYPRCKQTFY